MKDIMDELQAVHREVGSGKVPAGEGHSILLRRTYQADVEDVWDAVTNPERIARWFLPVSGDLRLGGNYQTEGNAGGEILRCEAPNLLKITWVFGDAPADSSEVEVRLAADGSGATVLELEHTAVVDPGFWGQFGPGAVGVGWDLGLLGLTMYLESGGASIEDKEAWQYTDEARRFMTASAQRWGAAHEASGATADEAAAAAAGTTAFYVPPVEAGQESTD
jgi:uncharacterized protein YndB with AHSA1/START domain